MADCDPNGRLLICRAKQLDEIPSRCHNCNSDDLQQIMEHVDGGSWICMTYNFLNSYEHSEIDKKHVLYHGKFRK